MLEKESCRQVLQHAAFDSWQQNKERQNGIILQYIRTYLGIKYE